MANDKNMNPVFSIKNFRSFGEEGADFELAPITVLTGCNSAGKSSLVKAILLLARQCDGGDAYGLGHPSNIAVKCPSKTLSVSSEELTLGRFDKLLNKESKSNTIELSYTIWSKCLQEKIRVRRLFLADHNDAMNNGKLDKYIIEKLDGTAITTCTAKALYIIEENRINYDCIEKNLQNFRNACDSQQLQNEIAGIDDISHKGDEINNQAMTARNFGIGNFYIWNKNVIPIRLSTKMSEQEKTKCEKDVYVAMINNEVVRPYFIEGVEYIDSSSANIKRIYTIEDKNKMSNALRAYNDANAQEQDPQEGLNSIPDYNFSGKFLNKWIQKFGLGDEIKIEGTEEGLGMMVYLIKNGEKSLLADEGYGITQLTSLLLCIDNKIPPFPNPNEGGVLTRWHYELIKEGTMSEYSPRYICVEEPENHLHPKFQSMLAEMFVEAYQKYNIHFIIETHSEYLIRKLQVMVADRDNRLKSSDVSLNYVDKDERGVATNRKIEILDDGRLSEPFGPGFYDEADSLAMNLMKYKARRK